MSSTPLAAAPLLLSVRDTARALAVCQKTIWQLTKDGKLPAVKIGRATRYDVADVRAFIEAAKGGSR